MLPHLKHRDGIVLFILSLLSSSSSNQIPPSENHCHTFRARSASRFMAFWVDRIASLFMPLRKEAGRIIIFYSLSRLS
ncbi:hypothetical protein RHMOL_Rhmol04G0121000 [Rhododendron molle]|uniref:Uncharacterized protein n=1 Tax=Rhododendron molle TaxID=49168 RepID=A0ACC0P0Q8_RHOML|nr:hypothetical protein RHMOL_Rhmol04G0121000 [Rhododendron molle]